MLSTRGAGPVVPVESVRKWAGGTGLAIGQATSGAAGNAHEIPVLERTRGALRQWLEKPHGNRRASHDLKKMTGTVNRASARSYDSLVGVSERQKRAAMPPGSA